MFDNQGMLSVIMPAYNEEENIYNNLLETAKTLAGFTNNFEIIPVNDGSQDQTKGEIKRAMQQCPMIHGVSYGKNGGKGKAIRIGVEKAQGDYIAFLDSDLDLHPRQLKAFLEVLVNDEADAVIGSKMHRDSKVDYPLMRKVISYGYYLILKILFRLNTKDTQTGIKMFKKSVIKPIIPLVKTQGFAYDIEILIAVKKRNYRIKEMPVELVFTRDKGFGRISFKDILKVFGDTWKIFYGLYFRHDYD